MKKVFFVVLMMCAAFAVFAQNTSRLTGVIRELTGEVELKPAGATAFTPARVGSEVAQNTVVSTGFKGTAIIAIGSSTITVKPLTRLTLSEIQESANAENVNLNLQAGRVRVDVKPPEGTRANFTVQSPSATASVRGTSFDFDTLNLNVFEGTVAFAGGSGVTVPVAAGFASYVGTMGSAANPQETKREGLHPLPPVGFGGAAVEIPKITTIDVQLEY